MCHELKRSLEQSGEVIGCALPCEHWKDTRVFLPRETGSLSWKTGRSLALLNSEWCGSFSFVSGILLQYDSHFKTVLYIQDSHSCFFMWVMCTEF